jgi:hypothetical protein
LPRSPNSAKISVFRRQQQGAGVVAAVEGVADGVAAAEAVLVAGEVAPQQLRFVPSKPPANLLLPEAAVSAAPVAGR